MRKHQQKQILDLLKMIDEAQTDGQYADCQEGAIGIGEFIEQIEGEGTQTVALLEEYCELLFKASNGESGEKQLRRHMIKIENSVKNELKPSRIEMAFLSYKASMSDSLESIYLTAKEDPSCDAYWIPIPYYDRNPDGSFGTMHYEGPECYGESFECTSWREYDLETRCPDAIFTFNPYDEGNYVTSVHPNFYCKRLRELTDMLVYVPYFVVAGDVPEHFCTVAGCLYAQKVIVQSEKIRDTYIRVFKEAYGDRFGKPEEKFVALGSPKFDKVISSKREDFVLPKEWAKIIAGKKAVFYNTSVTSILQGNEQYLEKLRHVLADFQDHEEIALWWRPHPLNEATYSSMRPHLLDEYMKTVADYKREGWGIYDDTPNLHRALAWTDAYYGDWSSLVPMYGVTGKPVVIQDIENTDGKTAARIAEFSLDDGGMLWGFDLFRDALFEMNLQENTARYAARSDSIPRYRGKEYLISTHRYTRVRSVDDEVYCFPYYTDSILIYNRNNKTVEKILLDQNYLRSPDSDGFAICYTIMFKEKIYCFGVQAKAIIVFDINNHGVEYDTELFSQIGMLGSTGQFVKYPLYISECSTDGQITLMMRNSEHLIRYTLLTQEAEIIASDPIRAQCVHADSDGSVYWSITESSKKLIKWSAITNETVEYTIPINVDTISDMSTVFSGIADCGGYLLLFPAFGHAFQRFDKDSGVFSEYKEMPMPHDLNLFLYDKPKRDRDIIYAFARYNSTMYELNRISGEITQHRFIIDEDSQKRYADDHLETLNANGECVDCMGYLIREDHLGSVTNVFGLSESSERERSIKQRENSKRFASNSEGDAGKAIFNLAQKAVRS